MTMPAHCKCCEHPQIKAIDAMLHTGGSIRKVGETFGISRQSVQRHKVNCLKKVGQVALSGSSTEPSTPVAIRLDAQAARDAILRRFDETANYIREQIDDCVAKGKTRELAGLFGQQLKAMETLAKSTGALQPDVQVQVNNIVPIKEDPEFAIIMSVLEKHPEIREELICAMRPRGETQLSSNGNSTTYRRETRSPVEIVGG